MPPATRKPKPPFNKWPATAQLLFEKYYALDSLNRSLENAAPLCGVSVSQARRWSKRYGYALEIERRDRASAERQRNETNERRRNVLQAAENGVGALITRYSAAAQGKCPSCMGRGIIRFQVFSQEAGVRLSKQVEDICPRCGGAANYDPMNLNMVAFDRAIARYTGMVGEQTDPEDNPRGPITHDEFLVSQQEMLERAGAAVARAKDTLALPAPIAVNAEADDDEDDDEDDE